MTSEEIFTFEKKMCFRAGNHRLHKTLSPLGVGIRGFFIHRYGTNTEDHEHQDFITKVSVFESRPRYREF